MIIISGLICSFVSTFNTSEFSNMAKSKKSDTQSKLPQSKSTAEMSVDVKEISNAMKIQGYTVIQVKSSQASKVAHSLYLKEHSSQVMTPDWPQGRTLLVYNVPAYCTAKNVEFLFQTCGKIQRVYLQPKPASLPVKVQEFLPSPFPKTFNVAYVVFKNSQSMKKACNLPYETVLLFSNKVTPLHTGLKSYIQDYEDSILDISLVEQKAESYLADYYQKKDQEKQQEKEMEGVPDEDGFIKVTRHGKNKGGRRTEESEKKGHEHIRKRRKKNELKDFYTFQFRETKRKEIADLQSKFEEDKRRVQQMKIARKFKPY